MISEIYPLQFRSQAMAVSTICNWAANFIVSYFFLQETAAIGKAPTFWIYGVIGIVAITSSWFKVPETKHRPLEEIEREVGGEELAEAVEGDSDATLGSMTDPRPHWPLAGHDELPDRLLAAYSSPERSYHDARHLAEVLDRLGSCWRRRGRASAGTPCCWRPGSTTRCTTPARTTRSAPRSWPPTRWPASTRRWPRRWPGWCGSPPRTGRRTTTWPGGCCATRTWRSSRPGRIATPPTSHGVRREYGAVPGPEFRKGRAAVLRALLTSRPCSTPKHARMAWEERARANVTRELSALEG